MMYADLKGKVALITGAGIELGIGQSIARRLAREGATVAVNDISHKSKVANAEEYGTLEYLKQLTAEIETEGGQAMVVLADVTNRDEVQSMVDRVLGEYGRIDILINNAGYYPGVISIGNTPEHIWDLTLETCSKGPFLCSKTVLPHLLTSKDPGRIINISSIAGKTGIANYGAYNAAKAALLLFTQTLAREIGRKGITVNAVCPGNVATMMGQQEIEAFSEEEGISLRDAETRLAEESALGRLATGDDIANVVAFLSSDQASYITGQAINVCGGIEFH